VIDPGHEAPSYAPAGPSKIGSFAQLRKATSIPIASGEHIQGRWEVYDYLKEGAIGVIQCDPEWCGGTTEL